ncbi:MAG: insulinase family protein [Proteobacteria bacterium]|nr:insulinase family protein [Pseudomonadota bacterium]
MMLRSAFAALFLLLAAASPAAAIEVQRVVSPGGIEAWLVEDHSNPIISLDMTFRGGAALDPVGKGGLANLVSGLIDEGAGDLDSQAFQGQLQDLSIGLSFSAGLDTFSGDLKTLTENRDTAFELLRLALNEARFDAEPIARIRSQILAGLARSSEDPRVIVRRTLNKVLFPEHAYGRPASGTTESVTGLTVEDLRRFTAERFARDVLMIGVVGDITAQELAGLLDETFLGLPATAAPVDLADTTPSGEGGVIVIEKDLPQSVVAFGHEGIGRADPDYYTAYVVNYILGGGGFSARLYKEIREKRGLAYSVYAYLNPLDHAALVMGGVATQNERVSESLDLIRAEWRRMAEDGPSEEELRDAKIYLTGSFPLRFSSSGRISGMLVGMQLNHLGIDYLDRRNALIEAVTLDDARRVARRLYDADKLTVIVVGRPEGVTATRPAPELES